MRRPIELVVPAKVIQKFKQESKAVFPVESYGYTVGYDLGNRVEIREIWMPERKDLLKYSKTYEIEPPKRWAQSALEMAEDLEMMVLGDIHSHQWKYSEYAKGAYKPDHAPSETDILSSRGVVHGICLVLETRTKKLKSSVGWYGPMIPVIVKRF